MTHGSLRVFQGLELHRSWARRHNTAVVAFDHHDAWGWHCRLVGDEGFVLLEFAWVDHADRVLTGMETELRQLPVAVDTRWEDTDQWWWGWVVADGSNMYIAQTDSDNVNLLASRRLRIECRTAGVVVVTRSPLCWLETILRKLVCFVDFAGTYRAEMSWHCVSRTAYEAAWQNAIEACRRGAPYPIAKWAGDDHVTFVEG